MLFSYDYGWWQNWRWQTNAPPLLAISMATAVLRGNTDGIAQCGTSKATLEATGGCHQATTHSVSPRQPPRQQANKQSSTNTPTLLAILMAMAMCWYVTARIVQWRRYRALAEATGCRHWASIMSNNIKGTWLHQCFDVFIIKTIEKGCGSTPRPLFSIGVWHIKKKRRAWLRWV